VPCINSVGAVIIIKKDILELKSAEEKIEYWNKFFTAVIDALPNLFYAIKDVIQELPLL